ncbi:hypothetical protein G6F27_002256 [Rhizopus arrhizus]|nr:hypothetical protein G6F27_002256 [Rhizopus arrhizus]
MKEAGIDTNKYTPRSIRSASSTKAIQMGFSFKEVKDHANWSNNSQTMEKYYYKPNNKDRTSTAMINSLTENTTISGVRTKATSIGVGTSCNTNVAVVKTKDMVNPTPANARPWTSNKPQTQPIQKLQKRQDESLLTGRKRSHSGSSNDSPSVLFSNNFSDSGSSSMASTSSNNNQIKRKRSINHTDSSSSGDNSVNISSSSSTSSSTPQILTAQRSVPAFLNKLYNMVDDEYTNDLIRWSKDGNIFLGHEDFARTVLPRFYKRNTFASFVRQLNMYNFHKIPHIQQGVMISESDHEIWEFSNPHFQRGRSDLLILVTRKKNKDRDTTDGDAPNINTLAEDLTLVKKHQATIGSQLMDLHRDNEILWQETLTSREKYHRHQEAIEKILLFLTAVFSTNDQLVLVSGKFTSKHLSVSLTL